MFIQVVPEWHGVSLCQQITVTLKYSTSLSQAGLAKQPAL